MTDTTTGPFTADTDAAGRWFGVRDTRDSTWLYWGEPSHERAVELARQANAKVHGSNWPPAEVPADPAPADAWPAPWLTADLALFADLDGEAHVLLIRRSTTSDAFPGAWALPGGFVNPDETSRAAAAREGREETGVEIDPAALRLADVADTPGRDPRHWVVSHVYTATLDHMPTPAAADDADAARWFPLAEALTRPLAFDHARLLRTAAQLANLT